MRAYRNDTKIAIAEKQRKAADNKATELQAEIDSLYKQENLALGNAYRYGTEGNKEQEKKWFDLAETCETKYIALRNEQHELTEKSKLLTAQIIELLNGNIKELSGK